MQANKNTPIQNGFTLIEVLVTVFLIGVSLVLYEATSKTVVTNRMNRYRESALRIADKKMQSLRTTSFASLPSTGSFTDSQMSEIPNGAGNITVTDLNSKTKDVKVTVTYLNQQTNQTQSVDLETYITQGGIGQ